MIFLITLLSGILLFITPAHASERSLQDFCAQVYTQNGKCPADKCWLKCVGGVDFKGCPQSCEAIPCFEIPAAKCPKAFCSIVDGCNDQKVCYEKMSPPAKGCGELGDPGQNYACCPNFIKRCGVEFFDGSCDMEGKNSVYSVPICLPCGNGICNQFENTCNCPEDCPPPGGEIKKLQQNPLNDEKLEVQDSEVENPASY